MVEYIIQEATLIDIADAIREKEGAEAGPLTITWDGDTSGKLLIEIPGGELCKVSDAVCTDDEIKTGTISIFTGTETQDTAISEMWDLLPQSHRTEGYVSLEAVVFVRQAGAVFGGITFPEAGVYFVRAESGYYCSAVTLPDASGEAKPIPGTDFAPRVLALPGRDGSVAVKWDGNTAGKTVVEREVPGTEAHAIFCKVTDWVFTEEQIKAGKIDMYGQVSGKLGDIWEDSPFIVIGDGYYSISGAVFAQRDNVVVTSDEGDIVLPEAGLWFSKIVNYPSIGDVTLVNSIFTTTIAASGGGGGMFYRVAVESQSAYIVNLPVNISAKVSVNEAEAPKTHALYNGVRLPKIPEDTLAEYPYCIIAFFNSTYRLIMAQNRWFRKSDGYIQVQKCPNADFTYNEVDWGAGNYYTSIGNWPSDSLIWSSHDIPNGSATATDIYFEGTDPVPTD